MIKLTDGLYVDLGKARSHKYLNRKPDGKGGWIYSYYKPENKISVKIEVKFDPIKIFNNFYEVGFEERIGFFTDKSQDVKNKVKILEKEISYKKDAEYCKILNDNGKVILTKKGTEKRIDFEIEEANKIKRSKIIVHNHIEDRSISPDDIFLALFLGIEEIKAVYENKTFSFKATYKEKSNNYNELLYKNKTIVNKIAEIVKEVQDRLQKNILMKEEKDREKEFNKSNFQEQRQICITITEDSELKEMLNMEYKEYDNINR